jgi:DUF4097 and DUF4098 domain-containing protein YvlB
MYTELMLSALVAAAAPQEGDAQRIEINVNVPPVRVEIPEVDVRVDELDVWVPGFEFTMPELGLYGWGWGAYVPPIEIHVPGFEMSSPAMAVSIPAIGVTVPAIDLHMPESLTDLEWLQDDWAGQERDWDAGDQTVDTDTTFAVDPSAVLRVRNHAGEVVIRTWDRNQVRVEARHASRDRVKILQSGSSVQIKSEARFGHPDVVDYKITAPSGMALDLWGFYADVSVDGARNGVRVETLNGDIQIHNAAGEISLRSVEGGVTVQRSQGRLEINNVENEISLLEFEGDVFVESIDGDIRLEGIEGQTVEAKTVDGDVNFSGSIAADGRYRLTTHDGDVIMAIPENANATVSVATFDGEFEAAFPIRLEGTEASRRFSFKLGNGSARIELHSFDGDIQIIRR